MSNFKKIFFFFISFRQSLRDVSEKDFALRMLNVFVLRHKNIGKWEILMFSDVSSLMFHARCPQHSCCRKNHNKVVEKVNLP